MIQELSDRQRFAVVPSFVGHGVGWHFHSAPVVSPVRNREPGVMVPGQTFTIEPILVEGGTRSKVPPSLQDPWLGVLYQVVVVPGQMFTNEPMLVEGGTCSKVPFPRRTPGGRYQIMLPRCHGRHSLSSPPLWWAARAARCRLPVQNLTRSSLVFVN